MTLHEWLDERDRLAGAARWRRSVEVADARESQPRLVAMVRVAVEALKAADRRTSDWSMKVYAALARIDAIAEGKDK